MRYITCTPGTAAVVLDSPHSGTWYPDDFGHACDLALLRHAEDTHVEKLYDFAGALGVGWLEAHFPRAYLDANRNLTELDVELLDGPWPHPVEAGPKVRLGKGLIWRLTDEGVPIYARKLGVAEVAGRIEHCWQPYHDALAQLLDATHARHGRVIHLNCHSMPSVSASHATEFPGLVHADFVVGDRDGSTASPRLTRWIAQFLEARGYSVSINHPYKGVELVRRYGRPEAGRHSIQLEANRRLYMDEASLALHEGHRRLKRDLHDLVERLTTLDPARC
ncbi:N-formylglutamate amidohydrolase [Caldimonas brevitalea]|uniref:N-formylglutamate amidohydrolase n=1 Tax=Caldimonas brevitalea TaxID=413882 RepID=A0A0G3BTM8_9BURK|nr:N-formylglutamate amidohydrolase [Caldimonas brevitalea]AKJ29870.1 N-formylglutamate amidohydrolase [Caldimonas brevitalea]